MYGRIEFDEGIIEITPLKEGGKGMRKKGCEFMEPKNSKVAFCWYHLAVIDRDYCDQCSVDKLKVGDNVRFRSGSRWIYGKVYQIESWGLAYVLEKDSTKTWGVTPEMMKDGRAEKL